MLDGDGGTHAQATATGYNGGSVANAGRYSWKAAWSRWVRIGDTGHGHVIADVADLEDRLRQAESGGALGGDLRPGDHPEDWSATLSGAPEDRAPANAANVEERGVNGRVYVVAGAGKIGPRHPFAVEPGRTYRLRGAVIRTQNSPDPTGDGVVLGVQELDAGLGALGTAILHTWVNPTVSQGVVSASVLIGPGDHKPRTGTAYVTPYLEAFGAASRTGAVAICWEDVTEALYAAGFATAAQGARADSAVQPAALTQAGAEGEARAIATATAAAAGDADRAEAGADRAETASQAANHVGRHADTTAGVCACGRQSRIGWPMALNSA